MRMNRHVVRKAGLCAMLVGMYAMQRSMAVDFYWQGGAAEWLLWNDLAKWSQDKAGGIAADHVPNAVDGDWLCPFPSGGDGVQVGKFDLGGGSFGIAGYTVGEGVGSGEYWIDVTNGTFTVLSAKKLGQYTTVSWRIHDSATLNYYAPGNYDINISDAENYSIGGNGRLETWKVCSGSTMNVHNFFALRALNATVEAGGTLVIDNGQFRLSNKAKGSVPNTIVNSGVMKLPNGLDWIGGDPWQTSALDKRFVLMLEDGGKLHIGGDFVKSAEERNDLASVMRFTASGGLIAVDDGKSVAFRNATTKCGQETFAEIGENASVEVRVPADSSLDMGLFTYGNGASVLKTGDGILRLKSLPSSLSVSAGSVSFGRALKDFSGVSFADGCAVEFAVAKNVIDVPPQNFSRLKFSVDCSNILSGAAILLSESDEFLEHVFGQIQSLAPTGMKFSLSDGAIRLQSNNAFICNGEKDLGDAASWGGVVPVGEPALISGESTVAILTSATPKFSSITLEGGATLKIVGSGIAIPKVTLSYPSRLLVPDGTICTLATDALNAEGGASGLPMFEIESGATVIVERNIVFRNVDFRLYGTIRTPVDGSGGITFGGSADGEDAYFAMTAIGGIIDIPCDSQGTSTAWKRFVTPGVNGSVTVLGQILLKDVTFEFHGDDSQMRAYNGLVIGDGNPQDLPFEIILDNTVVPLVRRNLIKGAAKVICRNGGGLWKPVAHPGVDTTMYVQGWSSVELVGPQSHFGYSYSKANPFYVDPWSDAAPAVITVRDGAWVAFHKTTGGNHGAFVSSNGVWRVPTLPYFENDSTQPPDGDARNWLSELFSGFKSVVIDGGSSLSIESWSGSFGDRDAPDWDRNVSFANVPITGAGDLVLTNGTPGRSFTAVITSPGNTATGRLRVADSDDPTLFVFDDGANWAGTVMGDAHIAFTNRQDSSKPATVNFNRLELTGRMRLRVWRGETLTNDMVNLDSPICGMGQIVPIFANGSDPADNDVVSLGTYPADAPLPNEANAGRNWHFEFGDSSDSGKRILRMRYRLPGMFFIIR